MEIEAKYAVSRPLDPAEVSSLNLESYHLCPLENKVHQDTVLDTAGRAVTGSGHGLRIRRCGNTAILTLKAAGHFSAGIHEREEFEAPLASDECDECEKYDLNEWPAEIAERVRALIGDEPLLPLIQIEMRRRTWAVERDGRSIGELAFDEGVIRANEQTEPVREIEVEIKQGGTRADLEKIGQRLCALLPLQPESRTKLQRGLALLDSVRRG